MRLKYFVKFEVNRTIDVFSANNFEELWHMIREFMLRNNTGMIEWMIRTYD